MSGGTRPEARNITRLALVGAGGATGTLVRHGCLTFDVAPELIVVVINLAGSAMLGALTGFLLRRENEMTSERLSALVGVGFCGGLTTFSTNAVDVASRLDAGDWGRGLSNLIGTAAICVLGAAAGFWILRPETAGPSIQ